MSNRILGVGLVTALAYTVGAVLREAVIRNDLTEDAADRIATRIDYLGNGLLDGKALDESDPAECKLIEVDFNSDEIVISDTIPDDATDNDNTLKIGE